ncbi:hypothetical protein ACO22_04241 [Paracoccidioides brasiliensis]|uniref:Uncharacterized protein n=1 Tax=Paracoccidioides brasiliensis TaxID=121759 RepID=A0A1D2JDP6_PARBR|nr:hypothetical protein ACO22_04241 [Paracoccidioides brasiliensis]
MRLVEDVPIGPVLSRSQRQSMTVKSNQITSGTSSELHAAVAGLWGQQIETRKPDSDIPFKLPRLRK